MSSRAPGAPRPRPGTAQNAALDVDRGKASFRGLEGRPRPAGPRRTDARADAGARERVIGSRPHIGRSRANRESGAGVTTFVAKPTRPGTCRDEGPTRPVEGVGRTCSHAHTESRYAGVGFATQCEVSRTPQGLTHAPEWRFCPG